MIGHVIGGKYEIVQLLGEGGMGAVYEAHRQASFPPVGPGETSERCAIKVINDEAVAKDEVLITRFEREALAAKKVVSPHIVTIFDAGHDEGGHPYMVMELLEGENALQLLQRIGPLPPQLAVRIAIQTCRGLADAHGAGVVHRDIKPANLFLSGDEGDIVTVKLLDFGVAKFKMDQASQSENESLTRTGSMLGSPMYMSPEQARGLKTIDHRADIWSMGIVLFQLLSGRVPYQDIDGLGELIITICSEVPPLVTKAAPWVPEALAEVIAGSLKLSTADRYQSARDMAKALEACLDVPIADGGWKITRAMIKSREGATLGFSPPVGPVAAIGSEATVALPGAPSEGAVVAGGNVATVALSPEELAKAAADDGVGDAEPGPSSEVKRRDERALDKHRDAQRAAMAAARLDPADKSPETTVRGQSAGPNWLIVALIVCVLVGVGMYAFARYSTAPATPSVSPSSPPAGAPSVSPPVGPR